MMGINIVGGLLPAMYLAATAFKGYCCEAKAALEKQPSARQSHDDSHFQENPLNSPAATHGANQTKKHKT